MKYANQIMGKVTIGMYSWQLYDGKQVWSVIELTAQSQAAVELHPWIKKMSKNIITHKKHI